MWFGSRVLIRFRSAWVSATSLRVRGAYLSACTWWNICVTFGAHVWNLLFRMSSEREGFGAKEKCGNFNECFQTTPYTLTLSAVQSPSNHPSRVSDRGSANAVAHPFPRSFEHPDRCASQHPILLTSARLSSRRRRPRRSRTIHSTRTQRRALLKAAPTTTTRSRRQWAAASMVAAVAMAATEEAEAMLQPKPMALRWSLGCRSTAPPLLRAHSMLPAQLVAQLLPPILVLAVETAAR